MMIIDAIENDYVFNYGFLVTFFGYLKELTFYFGACETRGFVFLHSIVYLYLYETFVFCMTLGILLYSQYLLVRAIKFCLECGCGCCVKFSVWVYNYILYLMQRKTLVLETPSRDEQLKTLASNLGIDLMEIVKYQASRVEAPVRSVGNPPAKEMAIVGGNFINGHHTVTKTPGVLSIRDAQNKVIGMGCRTTYDGRSVLLTANHVWKIVVTRSISESPQWVGAATVQKPWTIEHNGQTLPVDRSWPILLSSPVTECDLIMVEVPTVAFQTLQVKTLKCGRAINWSGVTASGFNEDGDFIASYGTVKSVSYNPTIVQHFATTFPGWSGTPLISQGKIVGLHTGVHDDLSSNVATRCIWLEQCLTSQLETSTDADSLGYSPTDNIPDDEPHKTKHIRTFGYDIEIRYDDKRYSVHRMKRIDPNALSFDDAFDYINEDLEEGMYLAENADFPKGLETPKIPLTKERCTPLTNKAPSLPPVKSRKRSNRRKKTVPDLSSQPSSGSTPLADIDFTSVRSTQKAVSSSSLERVEIERMRSQINSLQSVLLKLAPREALLQSGDTPLMMQPPKESHSSSRPGASEVQIVLLTRKQEKLYNRISHTRKFQQALGNGTHQPAELRQRLLEFVVLSRDASSLQQAQVFLSRL